MHTKILAIAVCAAVLFFVIELIRREKLTFKYALAWMLVSVVGIFFSIFDQFLFKIAYFFGFELPSNFIFFSLLCTFVFLSLLLTILLCQQNARNDKVAQKLGILESELQELKKKNFPRESRPNESE
jgi:hypothetical protein